MTVKLYYSYEVAVWSDVVLYTYLSWGNAICMIGFFLPTLCTWLSFNATPSASQFVWCSCIESTLLGSLSYMERGFISRLHSGGNAINFSFGRWKTHGLHAGGACNPRMSLLFFGGKNSSVTTNHLDLFHRWAVELKNKTFYRTKTMITHNVAHLWNSYC